MRKRRRYNVEDRKYFGRWFATGKMAPHIWVMGGIHGDEPAGVAAICAHDDWPHYCLVFPCVNALGLVYNRRYADWDHYKDMQEYLKEVATIHPPKLVIDLHEDDEAEEAAFYFYHNGFMTGLQEIVRQA